jgi:hypothetical protein
LATFAMKTGRFNVEEQVTPSRSEPEVLASEEYVVKAMPSILGKFDMVAIYRKPSAKAPVIHLGDEAPFLAWGRPGERTAHAAA